MSVVNLDLLTSLTWNLREMLKLQYKMKRCCGEIVVQSWRYPYLRSDQVDMTSLISEQEISSDRYIFVLELIYDSVRVFMYYFIEVVRRMRKEVDLRNITTPTSLSLAALVSILWEKLSSFDFAHHTKDSETKCSLKNEFCQTDLEAISKCECCLLAQALITSLVTEVENLMQNEDLESNITFERKRMGRDITEISNWGAMQRWVEAIHLDFEMLVRNKTNQYTSRRRTARMSAVTVEKKIVERKLEETVKETRKLLSEKETEIQILKDEISRLLSENIQTKKQMTALREVSQELKSENKKKEKPGINIGTQANLHQIEQRGTQKEEEYRNQLTNVEKLLSQYQEENQKLKTGVEYKDNEISELHEKIAVYSKQIQRLKKAMLRTYPDLNNDVRKTYKATGNPLTDLLNQVEANRIRIELLTSQNKQLLNTTEKIKAMEKTKPST